MGSFFFFLLATPLKCLRWGLYYPEETILCVNYTRTLMEKKHYPQAVVVVLRLLFIPQTLSGQTKGPCLFFQSLNFFQTQSNTEATIPNLSLYVFKASRGEEIEEGQG